MQYSSVGRPPILRPTASPWRTLCRKRKNFEFVEKRIRCIGDRPTSERSATQETTEKVEMNRQTPPPAWAAEKSDAETSMEVYDDLKRNILKNAILSGLFFVFYLSSTISVKAGLASGVGSCGSFIYLLLLIRDVDQLSDECQIPIKRVEQIKEGILRHFLGFAAHYQQALPPRMLVLLGLAVAAKMTGGFVEGGLSRVDQGCLLLGFLSYKIPLGLVIYDSLKPGSGESSFRTAKRPTLAQVDGDEFQTDLYGRRKPDVDEKLKSLRE